jgi:hypothetical protein
MSRQQLVSAYVAGAINRRSFVRGLTALGMAPALAASYAVALQPAAAKKGHDLYDFYGRPKTKADCKNGGFAKFGFKNQGQCIAFVNRHKKKHHGHGHGHH